MLLRNQIKYVNKEGQESKVINQGIMVGRATRDVELRKVNTQNGEVAVANVNVAINRGKNKDALFVRATFWENSAEHAEKLIQKGDILVLVGNMSVNKYTNKDGQEVEQPEITVSNWELIYAARKNDGNTPAPEQEEKESPEAQGNPLDSDEFSEAYGF